MMVNIGMEHDPRDMIGGIEVLTGVVTSFSNLAHIAPSASPAMTATRQET